VYVLSSPNVTVDQDFACDLNRFAAGCQWESTRGRALVRSVRLSFFLNQLAAGCS